MVDTFSTQINKSENLIEKVANLTINNEVGNDLIEKVVNFTINNEVANNLIDKVTNMTIKNVGNDLNGENASDLQVQFAGNTGTIPHQNLLSIQKIVIGHKEVPVLYPTMEPSIGTKNKPILTISTGVI